MTKRGDETGDPQMAARERLVGGANLGRSAREVSESRLRLAASRLACNRPAVPLVLGAVREIEERMYGVLAASRGGSVSRETVLASSLHTLPQHFHDQALNIAGRYTGNPTSNTQ